MRYLTTALLAMTLGVAAFAASPVPRQSKEFTFVEPNGKQTLLSSYKGKVVVMQFLYTTCPHCQALSKELTKMMPNLPGVQFVGIAFNEEANAPVTDAYIKQYGVGFPVAFASRDTVMSYLGLSVMDRFVVPQIAIVDKKGVVRAQSNPMGTSQLQDPKTLTPLIQDLMNGGTGEKIIHDWTNPTSNNVTTTPGNKVVMPVKKSS